MTSKLSQAKKTLGQKRFYVTARDWEQKTVPQLRRVLKRFGKGIPKGTPYIRKRDLIQRILDHLYPERTETTETKETKETKESIHHHPFSLPIVVDPTFEAWIDLQEQDRNQIQSTWTKCQLFQPCSGTLQVHCPVCNTPADVYVGYPMDSINSVGCMTCSEHERFAKYQLAFVLLTSYRRFRLCPKSKQVSIHGGSWIPTSVIWSSTERAYLVHERHSKQEESRLDSLSSHYSNDWTVVVPPCLSKEAIELLKKQLSPLDVCTL